MAIQHKDILDADRHEVKGASTALSGQVLKSNGGGATSFVNPTDLQNIQYTSILANSRSANINPSAVDTPLQATFDSTVSNTDISMNSDGTITINTTGLYTFAFNMNFGRSNNTGTSIVVARLLINDVQFGYTQAHVQNATNNIRPIRIDLTLSLTAGDTLKIQIMRDSAGTNDGGLFAQAVTVGSWGDVPSFFARGAKIKGGV